MGENLVGNSTRNGSDPTNCSKLCPVVRSERRKLFKQYIIYVTPLNKLKDRKPVAMESGL